VAGPQMTHTLQQLVDESHPKIEISDEWFYCLPLGRLEQYVPADMQILLDEHDVCLKHYEGMLKIRVNKVIKRVYIITERNFCRNTWVAKWPD
jgi:hypothetical protein